MDNNIIWIFGDQHRAQALSCNGDANLNTPNLDRLSAEGINFEHAVSGSPLCCPFRGSLLTSRYPHKCVPGHQHQMPLEMPTIAHTFKENDYDTAYFGKWHLDGFHESEGRAAMHIIPKERRGGFATWLGYENNNNQWDSWVHGHKSTGEEIRHYRLPGYETDCLTDLLIDYIKKKADDKQNKNPNFFAVLSVQPPHDPYLAPAEFMEHHNPANLIMRPNVPPIDNIQKISRRDLSGAYAQIENLDFNIGRVRKALADADLEFNTHIIFFSDHGDMHGSHGQFRKTAPWEESIRIPFIISGPPTAHDHKRGRLQQIINHVDIAPTTLGICNIDKPQWMKGFDYSGLYLKKGQCENMPDSAYIQSVIPTMHGNSIDRPWRGVVTVDGWKYVVLANQPWLMFNLNEDPYEFVNLVHNVHHKVERRELQNRLAKWITETEDQFDLPEL